MKSLSYQKVNCFWILLPLPHEYCWYVVCFGFNPNNYSPNLIHSKIQDVDENPPCGETHEDSHTEKATYELIRPHGDTLLSSREMGLVGSWKNTLLYSCELALESGICHCGRASSHVHILHGAAPMWKALGCNNWDLLIIYSLSPLFSVFKLHALLWHNSSAVLLNVCVCK